MILEEHGEALYEEVLRLCYDCQLAERLLALLPLGEAAGGPEVAEERQVGSLKCLFELMHILLYTEEEDYFSPEHAGAGGGGREGKVVDAYVSALLSLTSTPSVAVRSRVCAALAQVAQLQPGKLAPHLEGLVRYMLATMSQVGASGGGEGMG